VLISKGEACSIRLEGATGEVFATCPINGTRTSQSVEGVTDSSRYFVIRVEDGHGHHAFIGMGFTERSDAFDFNVALQDFEKHLKQRKDQASAATKPSTGPKTDFSLKDGQTIHVSLKTKPGAATASSATITSGTAKPAGAEGLPAPLLPPPPGAKAAGTPTRKPAAHHHTLSAENVAWGDFQNFQTAQPMSAQQTQPLFVAAAQPSPQQQVYMQQPQPQPQQQLQQLPAQFFIQPGQPLPQGFTIQSQQPAAMAAPAPAPLNPPKQFIIAASTAAAAPPTTPSTFTLQQPPFLQQAPQQQPPQQSPAKIQPFSFQ